MYWHDRSPGYTAKKYSQKKKGGGGGALWNSASMGEKGVSESTAIPFCPLKEFKILLSLGRWDEGRVVGGVEDFYFSFCTILYCLILSLKV